MLQQDKKIRLERLCNHSLGKNIALNAEILIKENRADGLILFDVATDPLKQEIAQKEIGSAERRDLLEALRGCYHRLMVQASLPNRFKEVSPPRDWAYYAKEAVGITNELQLYDSKNK